MGGVVDGTRWVGGVSDVWAKKGGEVEAESQAMTTEGRVKKAELSIPSRAERADRNEERTMGRNDPGMPTTLERHTRNDEQERGTKNNDDSRTTIGNDNDSSSTAPQPILL